MQFSSLQIRVPNWFFFYFLTNETESLCLDWWVIKWLQFYGENLTYLDLWFCRILFGSIQKGWPQKHKNQCTLCTPGRWQSKALSTIEERGSKIDRNSVIDYHLSPVWRQMAVDTLFLTIFDLLSLIVLAFSIAAYPVCYANKMHPLSTHMLLLKNRKNVDTFLYTSLIRSYE